MFRIKNMIHTINIMSKRRLFCSQLGTKYYGLICYHNIYFMSLVHTISRITVPNWEQVGVYSFK